MGVVAQSGKHGGDDGHVPHHVSWNLPHPFGQGLHVDGLDDLVCGPLHPDGTMKRVCFSSELLPTVSSSGGGGVTLAPIAFRCMTSL